MLIFSKFFARRNISPRLIISDLFAFTLIVHLIRNTNEYVVEFYRGFIVGAINEEFDLLIKVFIFNKKLI